MADRYKITYGNSYLIVRGSERHTTEENVGAAVEAAYEKASINEVVDIQNMRTNKSILQFTRRS